jgi:hypothetical protein
MAEAGIAAVGSRCGLTLFTGDILRHADRVTVDRYGHGWTSAVLTCYPSSAL